MTTTNRGFLNPGGLAAALICLVLTACGQPGSMDSGMMPMPDAHMPTGDGGMDTDAYVPPDLDAGMDAGDLMMCTADMMATRVSPPCDPDNNPDFGPGMAPTGLEGHIGIGHDWNSPLTPGFDIGMATDAMGRIGISLSCAEAGSAPYAGVFYYSADGNWYANWVNRGLSGEQGNHARLVFASDHMSATLEVYDGGSDTPRMTVTLWAT